MGDANTLVGRVPAAKALCCYDHSLNLAEIKQEHDSLVPLQLMSLGSISP